MIDRFMRDLQGEARRGFREGAAGDRHHTCLSSELLQTVFF